ncbi:MAG: glycosyltransferase family 4 protein [Solirubrobacterales bacterium]
MRVLTIGSMYPPHHLGGYELIWLDANRYLRDHGHEVRTLASDYRVDDAPRDDPADDVHRELRWYWRDHRWPRVSLRERVRLERDNAAVLRRHLDEFRPDAVAWWSMGGMSLSLIERVRLLGVPALGYVCDGWMAYGFQVDAWMRATRAPLVGRAAEAATGVPTRVDLDGAGHWLFMSELLRGVCAERRGLRRTSVAYKGADADVFRAAEPHRWDYRLLYAGRIDERKGIDLAIRALPLLPGDAHLTVLGGGDDAYLGELRALAEREGVSARVSFASGESRERLRDRYAGADALLFPVRWREPWGLVPLEAMLVGTPVVATGRGGSGEYLRDRENCLIFDPEHGPEGLAASVRELAADGTLRARLRKGGFATARSIDRDGFSAAGERILRELVQEAR